MSGSTSAYEKTDAERQSAATHGMSLTASRAARELGLKRSEFDIGVCLGRIRIAPDDAGGGVRRVTHAELERLRGQEDFPQGLRESVRTVGTTEGAALMGVPKARFTRLARLGPLVPVKFYLNRYRAVVWLYPAEEVRQFAADEKNAPLLKGRTPEEMRDRLAAGADLRPRNWRGRHLGFLLRQARDPWARAAAVAALLDRVQVAEAVPDPYERARLHRLRPAAPSHGSPGSPTARTAEDIMTAADPDEIDWLRADLARAVDAAREHDPAPRAVPRPPGTAAAPPAAVDDGETPARPASDPPRSRGLLGWLRRRGA
ncbi:DUF6397 family protein [Streptomyces sp. HMX87]|uniref:DUF6397 family protein n=1 Tax=Streptomyces sp. HMX87 TaxID=3390849 RepID=UPI003A8B0A0F